MQNNVKSSAVAGVLGVFLGAFGGHDWYLGNTKKAITHVCLCIGGVILLMIGMILMSVLRDLPALNALSVCVVVFSYIIIVGNLIWGFIEGVIILAQGDAGLAAKGYQVGVPTAQNTQNLPSNTLPQPTPAPAPHQTVSDNTANATNIPNAPSEVSNPAPNNPPVAPVANAPAPSTNTEASPSNVTTASSAEAAPAAQTSNQPPIDNGSQTLPTQENAAPATTTPDAPAAQPANTPAPAAPANAEQNQTQPPVSQPSLNNPTTPASVAPATSSADGSVNQGNPTPSAQ